MGFFDDDVYENLDWLSQATTPLLFSGNAILSALPDKIDVSPKNIRDSLGVNGGLYIGDFIHDKDEIGSDVFGMIKGCYNFIGEGDMLVDPIRNIFHAIQVVKIKQSFSEKEIIAFIQDKLRYMRGDNANRINEILDLIDYKPKDSASNLRSSRSVKKKMHGVSATLNEIFASNKWQVRDADLMISFIDWVSQYIKNGNLAALTNITKLKIMTHKKQPIYSIKEVV